MQHRMQQGGGMVYHQRNTGVSHRMMPQPQHASGQAQQPSDKKQSMVDRCVANLLYHRYPDAPAEPPDAFQEGGVQSQQMDGAGDGGNGRAVAGVPSGMNVIRGRHGSA
jgi:hypothetical protein